MLHLLPLLSISQLSVTAFTISLLPVNLLSCGVSLHFLAAEQERSKQDSAKALHYATAKASLGSQAAEHLGWCLASES